MGPKGSSRQKQGAHTDRQDRKDFRPDKRKPKDGGKKGSGGRIKPTSTRASGGAESVKPLPPPKPACDDPFKKYTREQRRAHSEKMKEERVAGTSGTTKPAHDKVVRAGALTESAR